MADSSRYLRYAALLLLGLYAAFSLIMGFGEVVGGDESGSMHLVNVVLAGLIMFLAWKRPATAGAILVALAVVRVLPFFLFGNAMQPGFTLVLAAAFLVAGLLLLATMLVKPAKN